MISKHLDYIQIKKSQYRTENSIFEKEDCVFVQFRLIKSAVVLRK